MYPYRDLINLILIWIYVLIPFKPLGAFEVDRVLVALVSVASLVFSVCLRQMNILEKIEEIKAKLEMDKK